MPRRSSSRFLLKSAVLVALAVLLTWAQLPAIDENLTKGATNNHIFESGVWGENIDLLNGGLSLTVPIGPTYKVSSDVSFQLKLEYSSKIWHVEESGTLGYYGGSRHFRARSRLQGRGQAGLGFMLQVGRYLKRANSPECGWGWNQTLLSMDSRVTEEVFEDSTGAAHQPGGERGSVDGSLLEIDPNRARMPDGTRHVFGSEVPDLIANTDSRWPRCGAFVSGGTVYDPNIGPASNFDIWTNDYRGRYVTRIEGKDRNPALPATVFLTEIFPVLEQ